MSPLELNDFAMSLCLSDVTIVIEDVKIPAHRLVLGAASPVLLSALTAPMKESAEGEIVIEDIEADVMKVVLNYYYTGKDESLDEYEMALKALMVAEKYEMLKLKALCERKLVKSLTLANALKILYHADTYEAHKLKEDCFKYIIEHRLTIIDKENFQEMFVKKPLLMMTFTIGVINETKDLVAPDLTPKQKHCNHCRSVLTFP